jgi:hypothetical protein
MSDESSESTFLRVARTRWDAASQDMLMAEMEFAEARLAAQAAVSKQSVADQALTKATAAFAKARDEYAAALMKETP